MKLGSLFTFTFALLAFCHTSQAAVTDGTVINRDVMLPLVAWVSKATQTQIVNPPIATASGRILKTALGLEGAQQARSRAAYLPGQIIISNIIWDEDSVAAQSYIVHELVHHAQLLSGRDYPCNAAKEREAYTLQNKWLAEHGEQPLVTDEIITSLSSCPAGEKVAWNDQ